MELASATVKVELFPADSWSLDVGLPQASTVSFYTGPSHRMASAAKRRTRSSLSTALR